MHHVPQATFLQKVLLAYFFVNFFSTVHISKLTYFSFNELFSSKTAIANPKNKSPYQRIFPLQFFSPISYSKHFCNVFNIFSRLSRK